MEVAAEGPPSRGDASSSATNGRSRRRWGIGLASVLLLAGLVAIIAVFAGKANKKAEEAPAASASGISAPLSPVTTTPSENAANPEVTKATNAALQFANKIPGQAAEPPKLATNLALAAAKVSDGATKMASDADTCVADDFDELKDAVENQTCKMVLLQAGKRYEIEEEIWVRRRVVVMGNPSVLPVLNGEDALRTFHVAADGFLELRFVQIVMSEGIYRDAYAWEFATSPDGKVNEVRGGSVMIDPGAAGGIFTGVMFIDDPVVEKGIENSIRRTLNRETYRIYGGHVFAAGGEVEFIGCLFFDLTVLYPFGNVLFIGADVLQLGGVLTFTGCVFLENTIIGVENGLGLFVAQFAGLSTYTFNTFDENNFAVMENCMGQAFLVAGGVMVMTLSNINEFSGALTYTGTGELNVLGGVMILTGVANTEAFALGSTFGVGFEYTVGGGVLVQTGSPFNEFNGLYYFAALGEINFVGGGIFIATGSPTVEYVSQAGENGQGGASFIGGGYGSWVGVPTLEFVGVAAVFMLGEYISVDAGFVVWVGSPVIEASCLEFCRLLGSVIYVGAGAMVLYGTPLIEFYGPYVTRTPEFWVQGTCESEGGGTITDGSTISIEGERRAQSQLPRSLYTLPTFVAPVQGCQKIVDFFYGIEKGNDGAGSGEGERRARALSSKPRPAVAASAVNSPMNVPKMKKKITGPKPVGIGGSSRRALPRSTGPRRKLTTKERELRTFFKQGGHTRHLPEPVRRGATNLWHKDARDVVKPKEQEMGPDGRALASATNPLDISLLAYDVTRTTEFDRNKLAKMVPASWLDNIDKMQAQIRSMHDGDKFPEIDQDRPAFNIDSKTEGYCGLCNVPGATGAGLPYCQYEEDCKNLQLPGNATLNTQDEEEALNYDDHYVLMSTISATTDSSVETLDLTELQEAIVAAVAEIQGADMDKESIVVNLYTGELDPQFGDMFEAPARSLFESDDFAKTHTVKMVMLATSAPTMNLIKASLDGNEDVNLEGRLAQNIRAAFAALSGIELGHVGITTDKEVYIPAYNSVKHVNGRHRSLGTHSMVLVDPDIPAVPTTLVKYGKTYHVYLENFPANSEVQVDLLKFKDNHEEEHVSHLVRHLVTDEEGHATVDFEFNNTMEPADYFFQAKTGNGEVGYSQSYDLSHQGQARRLFGVHMWV